MQEPPIKVNLNTFCSRPWEELHIEEDGKVTPCCVMPSNRFPMGNNLQEYSTGKALHNLKSDLLRGIKNKNCEWCWNNEKDGMSSHRKKDVIALNTPGFRSIHLRLTNVCNLKCRMCNPSFSSTWAVENKKHKLFSEKEVKIKDVFDNNEKLYELLKYNILEGRLRFIDISGGEPLITDSNFKLLNFLIDNKCAHLVSIHYSTNLMKLDYKKINLIDLWKNFKHVTIEASCDGWGEAVEYSRTGFSRKTFLECISKLNGHKNIKLAINCVVNIYSVWTLPEIEKFRERIGAFITYSPCYLPDHCNPQRLYKEDKEALYKLYKGNEYLEKVFNTFIKTDLPPLEHKMLKFNSTLDKYRGTSFFHVFPQYIKYYKRSEYV